MRAAPFLVLLLTSVCHAETIRSHPPVRPLPVASDRPLPKTSAYFVDAAKGDDRNAGSKDEPFKTVAHGLSRLKAGETLVLRGGTYHECVVVALQGKPDSPVVVRSYPGELAVLDGGYPEFLTTPAKAWEPVKNGEYRSTKAYPALKGAGRRGVAVLGNFADSMVPLHGYRFVSDFRTDNPYWTLKKNVSPDEAIWCGPGLWADPDTGRIHVRLAHTKLKFLDKANYRGETDPRKLPLVVAGPQTPLKIEKAKHVRIEDLVVRGSSASTVAISASEGVTLDGLTVYGGSPAVSVRTTNGLKLTDCAVRGLTAPWSSRASHKYRGNSAYLFVVAGAKPGCRDFELCHSEFTDNHDGLIVGTITKGLSFHHNLVDHFDDDGLYLTMQRPTVPQDLRVYQNVLSRCLTTFAFAQSKAAKNDVGPGVFIYRNVIDLRKGTPSTPPADEKQDTGWPECWDREGRFAGDHGSPVWEPLFVYHNTILVAGPTYRGYYAGGTATHAAGSKRRVFNNVVVHARGMPGFTFGDVNEDLEARGNLLWSIKDGPGFKGDVFAKFRASKLFEASKKQHAPGWAAGDKFADPKFVDLDKGDFRLTKGSPAVDAGISIPKDWPDPLRKLDEGKPDVGALPLGAEMLKVGPRRKRG
jgi:hypothetical protein